MRHDEKQTEGKEERGARSKRNTLALVLVPYMFTEEEYHSSR